MVHSRWYLRSRQHHIEAISPLRRGEHNHQTFRPVAVSNAVVGTTMATTTWQHKSRDPMNVDRLPREHPNSLYYIYRRLESRMTSRPPASPLATNRNPQRVRGQGVKSTPSHDGGIISASCLERSFPLGHFTTGGLQTWGGTTSSPTHGVERKTRGRVTKLRKKA